MGINLHFPLVIKYRRPVCYLCGNHYYFIILHLRCLSTYAKQSLPRHMSLALFYPFTILRNGSLTNLLLLRCRLVLVSDSKKALWYNWVIENDSVTLSVNELLYNNCSSIVFSNMIQLYGNFLPTNYYDNSQQPKTACGHSCCGGVISHIWSIFGWPFLLRVLSLSLFFLWYIMCQFPKNSWLGDFKCGK